VNFKFPTYPTGQIQLNRQHPLAKGLVWAGNSNSLDVNNFVDLSVRQLGLGQPVGNQSYTPIYNPEFGRGLILNGNSGFKFDRDWEVSELTVLAWVRCAAGGGSQAIICVPINEGTHNSPFWSWTLSQNNNFEFKLEWYDGSGQNVSYSGEPVFNNTDIVHLAITLSSAGNVEFFVNGVSVKTDTNGNSLQDDINQPSRS